jgi:chromosome segregation ATPase
MASEETLDSLRSPVRKLARFFRASRDRWKEKCRQSRMERKRLSNQLRAVEKSRGHWRACFQQERQKVRELQRELEQLKNASAAAGGDEQRPGAGYVLERCG